MEPEAEADGTTDTKVPEAMVGFWEDLGAGVPHPERPAMSNTVKETSRLIILSPDGRGLRQPRASSYFTITSTEASARTEPSAALES